MAKATPHKAASTGKQRDKWDILEIVGRLVAASLTAVLVAIVGYYGQRTLTELNAQEQSARLYTELLSRREDSESALRKDMFAAILSGFFDKTTANSNGSEWLSKKLLKLEMLALNFGDSLSLGPLFVEMARDIERVMGTQGNNIDWKLGASEYQKRLRNLARRVAGAQLAAITSKGELIQFSIPVQKVERPASGPSEDWQYTWPDAELPRAGGGDESTMDARLRYSKRELEGVRRAFTIQFRNANTERKSVEVQLRISNLDPQVVQDPDIQMEFTLDFFNFPLIDNTRLSNNHRFALIMDGFDEQAISVKGVLFPGLYASQRDKPFLNEAIEQLKNQQGLPIKQQAVEGGSR